MVITSTSCKVWITSTGERGVSREFFADISPNEDPIAANLELEKKIDDCNRALLETPVIPAKENIGTDEDIYAMMDKCKTPDELISNWQVLARQKKSTFEFYNKKLNQLTNG
jgi:hypothetical protein